MPSIFKAETAQIAAQTQDTGRLHELNGHELLCQDEPDKEVTFDEVLAVGRWFLNQGFDQRPFLTYPLIDRQQLTTQNPEGMLQHHFMTGNEPFLGKVAVPKINSAGQVVKGFDVYPITMQVVRYQGGYDLRVHIVPIDLTVFEKGQYETTSDGLLALAAAAAVAPQFVLALEGGIETTLCATKKDSVTTLTPDHGTPLAVTFDAFNLETQTLTSAIDVSQNQNLSIKQAAQLHGQPKPNSQKVAHAAAGSKIAAGVPIRTVLRSQLPKHALFISLAKNAGLLSPVMNARLINGNRGIDSQLVLPDWFAEGLANAMSSRTRWQKSDLRSFRDVYSTSDAKMIPTAREVMLGSSTMPYLWTIALFEWLMATLSETNHGIEVSRTHVDLARVMAGIHHVIIASQEIAPLDLSAVPDGEIGTVFVEQLLQKLCSQRGVELDFLLQQFDTIRHGIVEKLLEQRP